MRTIRTSHVTFSSMEILQPIQTYIESHAESLVKETTIPPNPKANISVLEHS